MFRCQRSSLRRRFQNSHTLLAPFYPPQAWRPCPRPARPVALGELIGAVEGGGRRGEIGEGRRRGVLRQSAMSRCRPKARRRSRRKSGPLPPAALPVLHPSLTPLSSPPFHSRSTVVVRAAKQLHFNKNGEALKRMQVSERGGRRARERAREFSRTPDGGSCVGRPAACRPGGARPRARRRAVLRTPGRGHTQHPPPP